jgi:hypothetical protein
MKYVGDADGVEADDVWLYGDSDVLRPALGVSPPVLNRSSSEYLDPSLQVGACGCSGFAFCPADHSLFELVEGEGTGSLLYICDNDGLFINNSSSVRCIVIGLDRM